MKKKESIYTSLNERQRNIIHPGGVRHVLDRAAVNWHVVQGWGMTFWW